MPIDPQMPDSITMSPQQQATTQGIAQSVANSGTGTPASTPDFATQHPVVAGVGNVLLSALQGFAMGRMGQDAVGQQLRAKYQADLMNKELANKQKIAKDQAFQEFVSKGVGTQGSQFLSDPKLRKQIGFDNLPMYEAMGKAVDHQKAMIAQAVKAAGLPESMANLPPDLVKAVLTQQAQKLQGQQFQQGQDTIRRGQNMATQRAAMAENAAAARQGVAEAGANARTAAQIASRESIAGSDKQQARFDKWVGDLTKQRNDLISKYGATDNNGKQKFTDKERKAGADAFNSSVDAQFKRFKAQGIDGGDPEAYKLEADPTTTKWGGWRTDQLGTLAAKVSDTAPPAPTMGVEAAPHALKGDAGRPPFAGAIRTTYDGHPGWRNADKTRFVPDA